MMLELLIVINILTCHLYKKYSTFFTLFKIFFTYNSINFETTISFCGNIVEEKIAESYWLNSYIIFDFRKMRNFDESAKSKKTVSSMIENKKEEKKPAKGKENKTSKSMFVMVKHMTLE